MRLIICGDTEADCECVLPPDHDGPHECSADCDGAWEYDDRGRFHIVRLPLVARAFQASMWESA